MTINKSFPYFTNLLARVKEAYPHISGEVIELVGNWGMNGCLDLQVTLSQDAPWESLQRSNPGRYVVHLYYDPYKGGTCGPAGWIVSDYSRFKGSIPCDPENDAFLKPRQTPYTRGFGEHWRERLVERYGDRFQEVFITGYPNPRSWDGKRLLARADYTIQIAD